MQYTLQKKILEEFHTGHPGILRMKSLMRGYTYRPRMDKDRKFGETVQRMPTGSKGSTSKDSIMVKDRCLMEPIAYRLCKAYEWILLPNHFRQFY